MEDDQAGLFTYPAEVLPANNRTEHILEQRRLMEKLKQDKLEQLRQQREKEEKERKKKERDAQREREKRDRANQEQARKQQEDAEQSKKMPGLMYLNFMKLQTNTTMKEMTFSGLEFNISKTRMLAYYISVNTSLCSVHLARRSLGDDAGETLALILKDNKVIRKMELEGNMFGTRTAAQFGKQLVNNKTLRYLDLDSNTLTQDNEDTKGMIMLCEALKKNKSLISLNIANNKLDAEIGKEFKSVLEINETLIDFEFGFNYFHLKEVRIIQEYLRRNKAKYDKARLREWKERKFMRGEDEALQNKYLKEQTQNEKKRLELETKEMREAEIEQKWKKMVMEEEIQKAMTIQQLVELAEIRGKGKKGKKGGKGKGKKKG